MATEEEAAAAPAVEKKKPEPPLVRASRVAGLIELDSVRFVQFRGNAHSGSDGLQVKALAHRAAFTRPKISQDGSAILITSTFVFSVSKPVADGQMSDPLASLRATIELKYVLKNEEAEPDADDLREFANTNVPFNSWGYWREFVQSALPRLGFASTITLPLFRVQTASAWMIDDEPQD